MASLDAHRAELAIDIDPTERGAMVLNALDDDSCRTVLRALSEPKRATEVVDESDIPTSTVYRKLNELVEAGLVEKTYRGQFGNGHQAVYRRRLDRITIDLSANGV